MRLLFKCAALFMVLATVVSANSYTSGANASANATIVKPARINTTVGQFSVIDFGSLDIGSLVIRLPLAAAAVTDGREPNITSSLLGIIAGNCIATVESLAACFTFNPESELLEGDPVSSVTLSVSDDVQSGKSTVTFHIAFN